MPGYSIRAEILTGFLPLCLQLGIDAGSTLARNQLSLQLIENPDLLLPYEAVTGALEDASRLSNRADFGSLLSGFQRPFPVGVPRLLMYHAASVREAFTSHVNYNHLHSAGILWHIEEQDELAYLVREDKMAGKLPSFQYAMLSLSHVVIAMRALIQKPHWRPQQFQFSYAEPALKPSLTHLYGTRIDYNHSRTAIGFSRDTLDISPASQDVLARQMAQAKIRQLENRQQKTHPQHNAGLIPQLERWIRRHIHRDSCHLAALAKDLELHPKKLQRELAAKGLNFRRLKAEIRLDMAEHYLRNSNLSLTDISALLGFGELSGFSRAFKHRHQHSPLEWRKHLAEAHHSRDH
ncbi:MAG: AraC family transcriptional regulator ligand-binding domain-containing protein [Cellvibrionaceae bacterium]